MMIFRGKNDKFLQKICKPDKRDLNHNSKRSENEYPLFKEFIDTSMKNICIDEYLYRRKRFATPGTFLYCYFYCNLCLVVCYYLKPKIENDAFYYRYGKQVKPVRGKASLKMERERYFNSIKKAMMGMMRRLMLN